MNTSDIILFHQSAQTMKHMGLLLLCYPIGILMTLYLHTPDPPSSFLRGLVFLWQESPSFYGYMLGFLMLSLLVYSIKLKNHLADNLLHFGRLPDQPVFIS